MREIYADLQIARRWPRGLYHEVQAYLRRPPAARPRTRFVIFGQGRTGSTLLQRLLDAHPAIECRGEILYDPVLRPVAYVERRSRLTSHEVFGFKVKIYQLTEVQRQRDVRAFLGALQRAGWVLIYLQRRNLLRHALSNLYAEGQGRYHFWAEDEGHVRRTAVTVDPDAVVRLIATRQRWLEEEARVLRGFEVQRCVYETDLLRPEARRRTVDGLFARLGVEPCPVATTLMQSVPDRLEDAVRNFAEVERRLQGTIAEPYLHDPAYTVV